MFWRYKNGADFVYHHAKFGGARTSHATRGRKSLTFFVPHAFEWQSLWTPLRHQRIEIWKRSWYPWIGGMFVDVHPRSTVSTTLGGATKEWQIWKYGKLGVFRFSGATEYTESDKIWRVNVDPLCLLKCVKFGVDRSRGVTVWVQEPQYRSFLRGKFVNATSPSTHWNLETILVSLDRGNGDTSRCGYTYADHDEIWHGRVCNCPLLKYLLVVYCRTQEKNYM